MLRAARAMETATRVAGVEECNDDEEGDGDGDVGGS
jgi:hypothetical protein